MGKEVKWAEHRDSQSQILQGHSWTDVCADGSAKQVTAVCWLWGVAWGGFRVSFYRAFPQTTERQVSLLLLQRGHLKIAV